ncbi:MAG: FHA domain-containing protein [Pirellulales bacterium]|nr:FHA domain-containing protein [Pirellulales bacterium]
MHVALEVVSGSSAGKQYQIRHKQMLTFGRTQWADVSFPHDQQMSSTHFVIERDDSWCWLKDLDSTNGTQLNDEFVKTAVVKEGDRIVAGTTEFVVHIRSSEDEEKPHHSTVPSGTPPIIVDSIRKRSPIGSSAPLYTVESCESGLILYRGMPDENPFRPSAIAGHLAMSLTLVMVIHHEKYGGKVPQELSPDAVLFDWLPEEAARYHSPVVLAADGFPEWPDIIDAAWDHDAIICFYLPGKPEDATKRLIENFRSNLKESNNEGGRGLLGFCWPSVLSQLLTFRDLAFIEQLIGDFAGILMEIPDLAATWQLFGKPALEEILVSSGFKKTD